MSEAETQRRQRLKRRYSEEVERQTKKYIELNKQQPTKRYILSDEELKQVTDVKMDCHRLKLPSKTTQNRELRSYKMTILLDTVEKVKRFNLLAQNIPCDIDIVSERYIIDGKSLMGLFSLDLSKPVEVKFAEKNADLARLYFSKFEVVE